MSTARDVMHLGVQCIGEQETLARAAEMMRDLHVGSLPVCGQDDRIHGIITDRDIVVRCIAAGDDPLLVTAGDLARGTPVWADVETGTDEILELMIDSGVRRIPVMEAHRIVGMISEADLAVHLDDAQLKHFAQALYAAPPNS
jgi:CBS domain-containing protein